MIDTDHYFRQVVADVHLNPVAAGVVADPVHYPYSGHREIEGACRPNLVHRQAVLRGFGARDVRGPADDYLHWVRSVAEARWVNAGITELPWRIQANHVDEIADADRDPHATTFDGEILTQGRTELEVHEFALRFEAVSDHALAHLASRYRSAQDVR